jgi:hypothetical protein
MCIGLARNPCQHCHQIFTLLVTNLPLSSVDPLLAHAYLGATACRGTTASFRSSVKTRMPIQILFPDGP